MKILPALGFFLLGILLLFIDALSNHWAATIFLTGKLLDLIDWVAFWR